MASFGFDCSVHQTESPTLSYHECKHSNRTKIVSPPLAPPLSVDDVEAGDGGLPPKTLTGDGRTVALLFAMSSFTRNGVISAQHKTQLTAPLLVFRVFLLICARRPLKRPKHLETTKRRQKKRCTSFLFWVLDTETKLSLQ